jgi:hypothetical protein
MAKYLVEQGRVVGCWDYIFSARRGLCYTDGHGVMVQQSAYGSFDNVPLSKEASGPSISPRATWRVKKKRSRMAGSGSLRVQISLLAAQRAVVLRRAGMQVDNQSDKVQHPQIILY